MPSIVTGTEYAIYLIGMAAITVVCAVAGVIAFIINKVWR